jgi:1-acyl-sn-glycerol-3-phosphate acyltransferase
VSFYRIVRLVVAGGTQLLWRVRTEGRDRLPQAGGYVLAPSHRSMMDIPLLALVTPRRIRFMGKAPLFRIPLLGAAFGALGGFPVERDGTDRRAVRDSVAMLQAGEVLAVYPEGTRQHGPKIQPLQPGAAYLAMRAGVPVVPVGIAGSEEILRSHGRHVPRFERAAIVVGAPIAPPARTSSSVPRSAVEAMTARLHDELQAVFEAAYRLRDEGRSAP